MTLVDEAAKGSPAGCGRAGVHALPQRVALLGGLAAPREGLRVVPRYALALLVHGAECGLCAGVALPSERPTQTKSLREVIPVEGRRTVFRGPPSSIVG